MKSEINLREDIFFCAWQRTYMEQLESLHKNYQNSPEGQSDPLTFLDFCIFVFQNGGDIIDKESTDSRQN